MSKSALIIGIAGQNGRLLTEFLLDKGYRVAGFGWKDAIESSETLRPFRERIAVCYGDLRDAELLAAALTEHPADEIYNFAAQSQPGLSWRKAVETGEVNGIGAHRLFETGAAHAAAGAHLPGVVVGHVRNCKRIPAAGDDAVPAEQPLLGRQTLRAPDRWHLSRASRRLHRLRHPLQPREPLPRHGLHQPEDHVWRGLRQTRHTRFRRVERARRADGEGRQAHARQPRRNARLGLRRRLRSRHVADAAAGGGG